MIVQYLFIYLQQITSNLFFNEENINELNNFRENTINFTRASMIFQKYRYRHHEQFNKYKYLFHTLT